MNMTDPAPGRTEVGSTELDDLKETNLNKLFASKRTEIHFPKLSQNSLCSQCHGGNYFKNGSISLQHLELETVRVCLHSKAAAPEMISIKSAVISACL